MSVSFLLSSRYWPLVVAAICVASSFASPLAAQPGKPRVAPIAAIPTAPAAAPETPAASVAPTPPPAFSQPEFPGGDAALITFLGQTMHYPADAYEQAIEGRVSVSFWIDEQGRAYGFGVVDSPHPSLTAEALRALQLMPAWTPGRRDGRIVPLLVHVPIMFRRPPKH